VLVMISSMSVPNCNCFHTKRSNTGEITTFQRSTPYLTCAYAGALEPRLLTLGLLKSVFNALQSKIAKTFTKISILWGSRSFKDIDVDKSKKPVASGCYDRQHVCTNLLPFSHYTSQQQQNNVFRVTPL